MYYGCKRIKKVAGGFVMYSLNSVNSLNSETYVVQKILKQNIIL